MHESLNINDVNEYLVSFKDCSCHITDSTAYSMQAEVATIPVVTRQ